MSEEKTYQPHWGERRRHHHHHHNPQGERFNGLGGKLKMRDKQAYYGLILVIVAVLGFGAYKLVMLFVDEIRAMKNEVQHLIETEQYEKAMKLRPKIIEREKMVEEAAQAFNRHSAGMRIALDGETEE